MKKQIKKDFYSFIKKVKDLIIKISNSKYLIPLVSLNILSALAYTIFDSSFLSVIYMCSLGTLWAIFELLVIQISKRYSKLFAGFFLLFTNILIFADYYCIVEFGKPVNQDVIDIILETNVEEITNFANTYISFKIPLMVIGLIVINYLLFKIRKITTLRISITIAVLLFACIGAFASTKTVVSFVKYRNGMGLPQFSAITRICYSFYVANDIQNRNYRLIDIMSTLEASKSDGSTPILVLIIGESHNVHHSQLYGYDKKTQPNLTKRVADGQMAVFSDIVAGADHTAPAMSCLFSVNSSYKMGDVPIFPMVFKKAGYSINLWDNQYFSGKGISFLSNKELSDILFDKRNNKACDDGLIAIKLSEDLSINSKTAKLYIIHLMGQHYTYSSRYPDSFNKFCEKDYPEFKTEHAKVLSEYDNAVLYGDYVVDSIIKVFESQECAIVYISDHGEEIFDVDNFSGHGNAHTRIDKSFQLHIPMYIWLSEKYRESHPNLTDKVFANKDLRGHQRDVSQILFGLAEIESKWVDPTRNILSESYDQNKPRIVLNSVNYDAH